MLERFAGGLAELLGGQLVGVYLHGSLALGCFDPAESDVDFLVATELALGPEDVARLDSLHRSLGELLDGSYLPWDVLRRYDSRRVMHPHIESRGGRLRVDHHGGETVIYRHVLRKCGVVLLGPPPRELIDEVDAGELRWAVCDVLTNWWVPMLTRPPERLLEPPYRAYAVVTMCRMRYTLETADVVSKTDAARWALEHVDGDWHDLIRRAVARGDCGYEETVAFVRSTLAVASC
jgi:predicted nucleotidyltransferase